MYLVWVCFTSVKMPLPALIKTLSCVHFGGRTGFIFFFFSGWRMCIRQKSRGMFLARGKCQPGQCMQLSFFRRSKLLLLLYPFEGKSFNWWIEMGFAGQKWALTVTPKPIATNEVFLIPSGWVQLEPNAGLGLLVFNGAPDRCSSLFLLSPVPHEVWISAFVLVI